MIDNRLVPPVSAIRTNDRNHGKTRRDWGGERGGTKRISDPVSPGRLVVSLLAPNMSHRELAKANTHIGFWQRRD